MNRFRRLIALLLFSAYTLTGTMVLPATIAWLGVVGGEHEVSVEMNDLGVSVTLIHASKPQTSVMVHHQNTASCVATSICGLDGRGNHQLNARTLDSMLTSERELSITIEKAPRLYENESASILHRLLSNAQKQAGMLQSIKWREIATRNQTQPQPMMATVQMLV